MTETEEMGMTRCYGSLGGGSTGRGSAGSAGVYRGSAGGDSTISMDSSLTPVSPRQGSSGRGSSGSVEEVSPTPKATRRPSRRMSAESAEEVPLMPLPQDIDLEQGDHPVYDNIPMMDAFSSEVVSSASTEIITRTNDTLTNFLAVPNGELPAPSTPNGVIAKVSDILNINVGGRKARLSGKLLLAKIPEAKLGVFASKDAAGRLSEADAFFESLQEYYFERSPIIFEYIVDFYVTGKLHRPMDVCPIRLRYELDYWRIPMHMMSPCCQLEENNNVRAKLDKMGGRDNVPPEFEKVWLGTYRKQIYQLLENPRSSGAAKIMSFVSAGFVLLSLTGLILSSMPECQNEEKEPHISLHYLEGACMVYFTLEYLVRFVIHPKKYIFMCSPLNVIDLLTIIPFLVEAFNEMPLMKNFRGAMLVVRVMRLARVARIFKLARYSTGLRAFGETMKKSAAELSMLGMFLVTGIMLFSTAIYFFERDEPNSKFYSIPAACWWCVITMTTVGYGDLVPVTAGGKFVAALASVCGIIVLAFPISMIIDKFAESTSSTAQANAHWSAPQEDVPKEHSGGSSRRKQTKRYLF